MPFKECLISVEVIMLNLAAKILLYILSLIHTMRYNKSETETF